MVVHGAGGAATMMEVLDSGKGGCSGWVPTLTTVGLGGAGSRL